MIRLLITIILAGGGVFLLQTYVQPELAEVRRVRAEQAVVSEAISKGREVIRLRDELLGRYNSISPNDIDKIRKFLPAGSAISELFIDVNTMAASAGINMESIKFTEEMDPPPAGMAEGMQALSITMGVTGTYEQFRSFIALVEKNIRLIDVVDITLGQSTQKTTELSFTVVLRAYYQQRTIL